MAASIARTNVFEAGKYKTELRGVDTSSSDLTNPPPKPLLIGAPAEVAGEFPVMMFLHGFMMNTSFYSQLIQRVSSHGFIVVAPQLHIFPWVHATDDINAAAATMNWLSAGLGTCLPDKVRPNLTKLALAGHSRGGKVAFALALGKSSTPLALPIMALLGIDPVDGMDEGKQTPPPVLTYVPQSFDLNMPVVVVGSGLGEHKKFPLLVPACAPKGVNHADFFGECQPPACYFVAEKYGHMDMLNDDLPVLTGWIADCMCKGGTSREPMRRFVGGVMVAFLRDYLEGDDRDLMALKDMPPDIAPMEIKVEFRL